MAIRIQGDTVIYDDKVFRLGQGTTAQRPASPAMGMIWYNTDLVSFEGYNGTAWAPIGGGADELAQTLATLALDEASRPQLSTAVASTSGTFIDFSSIPSWAKRVTVLFNGVSVTASDNILVQVIVGGSPVTSGYSSVSGLAGANFNQTSTGGFVIYAPNTTGVFYGAMRLHNITGNTWVEEHSGGIMVSTTVGVVGGGVLAAAGVLTGVRVTVSGSNTFDAGQINVMWE